MADEEGFSFSLEKYAPWYVKKPYIPIFGVPPEPWDIDVSWRDGYFYSAKLIIEGVVDGSLRSGIHGIAGVFLFRHYIELALKYIVFHARWLKDANTNAKREEIQDVKKTHSLRLLWDWAQVDCKGKIPDAEWDALDTMFVEKCIAEFEAIDPHPGDRFRYHGKVFGVDKRPDSERSPTLNHLAIEFYALLIEMQHIHDVLNAVDVYLFETHGENADWQEYLNSL